MKAGKNTVALFVALAFISPLRLPTMPLQGGQAPDRTGTPISSAEQGPGFMEEEGYGSAPAKKSIVPVILIGVGVAALAAVLVLVVCKTKYDIVGSWTIHVAYDQDLFPALSHHHVFTGDRKSGTTTVDDWQGKGTYTVDGKKVEFTIHWAARTTTTFTGAFDGKDRMSGRFYEAFAFGGTWTRCAAPRPPDCRTRRSRAAAEGPAGNGAISGFDIFPAGPGR